VTGKELARLLGISPQMVSKLRKRGMPTDSLERAQRWRRRNLEPGRVKGVRVGAVSEYREDDIGVERQRAELLQLELVARLGVYVERDGNASLPALQRAMRELAPGLRSRVRLPLAAWDALFLAAGIPQIEAEFSGEPEPERAIADAEYESVLWGLASRSLVFAPGSHCDDATDSTGTD
jgi:transcriptional regulator with XRE-family HTH domain